jgi:hypothetical protein
MNPSLYDRQTRREHGRRRVSLVTRMIAAGAAVLAIGTGVLFAQQSSANSSTSTTTDTGTDSGTGSGTGSGTDSGGANEAPGPVSGGDAHSSSGGS